MVNEQSFREVRRLWVEAQLLQVVSNILYETIRADWQFLFRLFLAQFAFATAKLQNTQILFLSEASLLHDSISAAGVVHF